MKPKKSHPWGFRKNAKGAKKPKKGGKCGCA